MKLRHENEAIEICKGMAFGLYRAEQHAFELREYAEDCPSELAAHAVNLWQRRRRHCTFPRSVIEKFTPDWDWLLR